MRRLGPIRALFAGLMVAGLGYVYVGRIGLALTLIQAYLAVIAIVGWSKLIFHPWSVYVLGALGIVVALWTIIHPVAIALIEKRVRVQAYNRW